MNEILTLFDGVSLWVNLFLNWHASPDFILNIVLGNLGLKFAEDGSLVISQSFYGVM